MRVLLRLHARNPLSGPEVTAQITAVDKLTVELVEADENLAIVIIVGYIGWLLCFAALLGVTFSTASVSGEPLVPREFDVWPNIRGLASEVFRQLKSLLKSRKPRVDQVFR
jgi:hypothetical protein